MAFTADSSTVVQGLASADDAASVTAASAVDAASADLATASRDREKRQREEAQTGSAEHIQLFRAALAKVVACRLVRKRLVTKFSSNSRAWCREASNRAELASAHSQVEEALAQAAALRAGIHLDSLTPRVKDSQ